MTSSIYTLLAQDLAANLDRFIDRVAERTLEELPEIMDDAERSAFARTGARALMTDFIDTLELGVVEAKFHAPAAAVAVAQRFARDGISIDIMLRAYRLGHELVFERAARVADQIAEADQRSRAIAEFGALSFRYMDGVTSDVSRAYDSERERALRGLDARRLSLMRDLVAGVKVEVDEAERVLGWRVDGRHQAVVAFHSGGEDAGDAVLAAAVDVASAIGEGRPLAIAGGDGEVTVWITPAPDTDRTALDALATKFADRRIQVTIGNPAPGLQGLAATKRQADLALTVAKLQPDTPITHYQDVSLAALLLRDGDAAVTFATEELGPLARDTGAAEVLRQTLTAFCAMSHDQSRTARSLGIHRNTVANRVRQAERKLGHRVDNRPLETAAALLITSFSDAQSPINNARGSDAF